MITPLDGCTAIVTGASSGIGAATARALTEAGATVALLARRRDRLDELAGSLTGPSLVREVDVTDHDAVRAAVESVVEETGRLDVLVNNAGTGSRGPALGSDVGTWQRIVDVNLSAVLHVTHAALPHLVAAAGGPRGVADLVTVSSVAGRKATADNNVYAASKHAVGAFSESLRQELASRGVRVGLVEPGMVHTEMTADAEGELGFLEPEDIADAIRYAVTRPARMAVNEILVRPTAQER